MRPNPSIPFLPRLLALLLAPSAGAQTVAFQDPASSGYESIGFGAAFVALSSASASPVTVRVTYTDESAVNGRDYQAASGIITIPAGRTSALAAFTLLDNSLVQPLRTFRLDLSSPAGAALGVQITHQFTLVDDDSLDEKPEILDEDWGIRDEDNPTPKPVHPVAPPVVISFTSPVSEPGEDAGAHPISIRLSTSTNAVINVPVSLVPGTATAADATLAQATLSLAAGATTGEVVLNLVNDTLCELPERLQVVLGAPSAGTLGPQSTHTVRIRDNDRPVASLLPAGATRQEEDETVRYQVRLTQPADYPVAADIAVSGTADPDGVDYRLLAVQTSDVLPSDDLPPADPDGELNETPAPTPPAAELGPGTHTLLARRVVFAPGQTVRDLDFLIEEDDRIEEDEDIQIRITQAWNATVNTNAALAVHVIEDDDLPKPLIGFEDPAALMQEGDSALLRVVLEQEHNLPVTFRLSLAGNALAGQDYRLPTGPHVIPPGQTSLDVSLDSLEDATIEPDEVVIVEFDEVINAVEGETNRVNATIFDNDTPVEEAQLFTMDVPANEPGRILRVLGPRAPSIQARGLAVDRAGNRYITEYGSGLPGLGSVWMIPAGSRKVLRLVEGLTAPSDIEVWPDGRSLAFSEPSGKVTRIPFGLSIKVTNLDPFAANTQVTIQGPFGTSRTVKASSDGWFHFMDLLKDYVTDDYANVSIESGGRTATHLFVPLGHRESGFRPFGQTLVRLEF